MPEWLASEVSRIIQGHQCGGSGNTRITGVSTDSRRMTAGDLFFALTGDHFDGHQFCRKALEAGAVGVVVSRADVDVPNGSAVLQVDDPLLALGRLAAAHRDRFDVPVIGITGSVGKSTTKEWTAAVLSTQFHTLSSRESYNNEIGLPLTLLELTAETQVVVLEMAMRGPGQIDYLCGLARPSIGVITNIGVSHLELLGSVDNIAEAKGELFEALPEEGTAVVGRDDEYFEALVSRSNCPSLSFGLSEGAQVRARDVRLNAEGYTAFDLTYRGERLSVTLPAPGRHNVLNALATAAACLAAGMDAGCVAAGLSDVPTLKMRLQPMKSPQGFVVLSDCYNSAPDSARAALEVARDWPAEGRRLAVLGDMKELGPNSPDLHRAVGKSVTTAGFARLLAIGDEADALVAGAVDGGMDSAAAEVCDSNPDLVARVLNEARPGDLVLVKGSRAMQLEEVVEAITSE